MRCPYCNGTDIQVLETRDADDALRRRRICRHCERRFTTYERVEELPLIVRKRDQSEQPFDREKLLRGLLRATTKRPTTIDQVEEIVDAIASEIRSSGGTIESEQLGELALASLRELDPVAYVRFASVYRNFADVQEFEAELTRLSKTPAPRRKNPDRKVPSEQKRMIHSYPLTPAVSNRRAKEPTRGRS